MCGVPQLGVLTPVDYAVVREINVCDGWAHNDRCFRQTTETHSCNTSRQVRWVQSAGAFVLLLYKCGVIQSRDYQHKGGLNLWKANLCFRMYNDNKHLHSSHSLVARPSPGNIYGNTGALAWPSHQESSLWTCPCYLLCHWLPNQKGCRITKWCHTLEPNKTI